MSNGPNHLAPSEHRRTMHTLVAWRVSLSGSRTYSILIAFLLLAAAALPTAMSLRIDTDLRKLLPNDDPAVQGMHRAIEKLGDLRYFTLLVESDDPEMAIRYAGELSEVLRTSDLIRSVIYTNPVDFIHNCRFLLTPLDVLEKMRSTLEKERIRQSPMDLGLEPAPEAAGVGEGLELVLRGVDWRVRGEVLFVEGCEPVAHRARAAAAAHGVAEK